jgi:membrane fusion protein, multidrug efflux system
MTFRSRSVLHLTFLVAATSLAAGGCRRSEAESQPQGKEEAAAPIAIKQVAAQALKLPRTLTLSGSLIGSEEAKVAAGAVGKVISTSVERGSVVRKGAVLAKLDARALGA